MNKPLYALQGGGTGEFVNNRLVFVEVPKWMLNAHQGDLVPEEWDYQPMNQAARDFEWDEFNGLGDDPEDWIMIGASPE
jgi:hypothetical protein